MTRYSIPQPKTSHSPYCKEVSEIEINLSKCDGLSTVEVDGKQLYGVKDYKITSLASGKTRLVLVLEFNEEIASTRLKV